MEKLKMESVDMTQKNIEKIGTLFPNVITEMRDESGNLKKGINFELLKQELSGDIADGEESYDFTWVGKKGAIVEGNTPIRKTLRPCLEESKDWGNTGNLYIEGDSLDVLKLLQESYLNSVKMIYIDPPYNTGKDFIYRDNFTIGKEEYDEQIGLYDENENRLFQNNESNGRFHSDWCSMLYPRLRLAYNILSDDGIIFISIDDNEVDNLKKICNEVFGQSSFVAQLPTIMNLNGNNDAYGFVDTHEYTLVYVKNREIFEFGYLPLDNDELKTWDKDEYGFFKRADTLRRTGQDASRESRPKGWFPVFIDGNDKVYVTENDEPKNTTDLVLYPINENGEELSWTWSKAKITNESYNLIIVDGRNGKNIYKKQRPIDGKYPTKKPKSLMYKPEYSTSTATIQLKTLFGKKLFDGPKPVPLISDFIRIGNKKDGVILDFLSGSATSAHAVMQLNAEDNGNRKFIMVQLPEECDEKSEAFKAGYKNISEIGKERIRRSGEKINEEIIKNNAQLKIEEEPKPLVDIGFRVLKVDSTNMKDVYYAANEYSQSMLAGLESNIKEDRTDLDLLYGVLLDWGLPLSLSHTIEEIEGVSVHTVDEGSLVACFAEKVSEGIVREIAKRQPLRVVFRDSSFTNSPDKINVEEIFKLLAPYTTVKVI